MRPEQERDPSAAAARESIPTLEPYQRIAAEAFLGLLPDPCTDILEIGSDIECRTMAWLATKTGARVTGINPSPEFATSPPPWNGAPGTLRVQKGDGRDLDFEDGSFDAVLSIATMEHVNGVENLLAEVARVLRPGGVFHTTFDPIWTCGIGHHTYAVVGSKEARFWKPGRNPVPDFAHLLMTPEEMRGFLKEGPCSDELIDPIIDWIYHGDDLNRLPFSGYVKAFEACPLQIEDLRYLHGPRPTGTDLETLRQKHGNQEDFTCSGFMVTLRKTDSSRVKRRSLSQSSSVIRRVFRIATSPRTWRRLPHIVRKLMSPEIWTRIANQVEDLLNDRDR